MILRVRFTKNGKIRFVGHRDLARIWERALRRVGVPVDYTEGFSPRPRVSFGLALPLGDESDGEYLDVRLDGAIDGVIERRGHGSGALGLDDVPEVLSAALPVGLDVVGATVVDRSVASLQEAVVACSWWTQLPATEPASTIALADTIRSAGSLPFTRTRKGKTVEVDLAPAVESVEADTSPDGVAALWTTLAASPFVVRPRDLLAVVLPDTEVGLTRRTHQWIEGDDGDRREPISLSAPRAATTHGVAS